MLARSTRWREGEGWAAYLLYRALSHGLSPLAGLLLRWRRARGLEHPSRWRERLGCPSSPRPPGRPLLWFHAVSLGEGLAAIPLIRHCLLLQQQRSGADSLTPFTILMTTTTVSAFDVIDRRLPDGVIHQFAPIDTPAAVDDFIGYWNPSAIFLMESEIWPNLILSAAGKGIAVALLNARISANSFKRWSGVVSEGLISLMLSKFSLIAALSTEEAVRFQLLQAPPNIIHFPGNLKYALGDLHIHEDVSKIENLHLQLAHRPVWMASSIHSGEETVMLWIHDELVKIHPNLVTIIVPRHPLLRKQISTALQRTRADVVLRSESMDILPTTEIYIVDTLGELGTLYKVSPIAVIGGSFLPNLAGHNIAEAAAVGCAVLTGPHVGHFSCMIQEMQCIDHHSVWQVSGKVELLEALCELLNNVEILEFRRRSARNAFLAVSSGIVRNVWDLITTHVLKKSLM